jgi:hypothetical protein
VSVAPHIHTLHEKLDLILTQLEEMRLEFRQKRDSDNERWERIAPALCLPSVVPVPVGSLPEESTSERQEPDIGNSRKRRRSSELNPGDVKRLRFALSGMTFQKT